MIQVKPSVEDIRKSLDKRTRVTLVDRLLNVVSNVIEHPITTLLPILAAGSFTLSSWLGVNGYRVDHANKGYELANTKLTQLIESLDSSPDFYVNPPITPAFVTPIVGDMNHSLTNSNSAAGTNAMANIMKFRDSLGKTNATAQTRKELLTLASNQLKPLAEESAPYILFAALAGLVAIVLTIGSGVAIRETSFEDYNRAKKRLSRDYRDFVKILEKRIGEGKISVDTIGYFSQFFSGLNYKKLESRQLNEIIRAFSKNCDDKHSDLLKILATDPRRYTSASAGVFELYDHFDNQDRDNPLKNSLVKSRRDLFLNILVTSPSKNLGAILNAIDLSLNEEKNPDSPDYLESLIKGIREPSQIVRAQYALQRTAAFIPRSVLKNIVNHYLSNKKSPDLLTNDLGLLNVYANTKCNSGEYKSIDELMQFLLDINNFRTAIPDCADFLTSGINGIVSRDPKTFAAIDLALGVFKKNPEYAQYALGFEGLNPNQVKDYLLISDSGFVPTKYLVSKLANSGDKQRELEEWKKVREEISKGQFDPSDLLKRDIEYTNFCKNAKVIGRSVSYKEYQKIFLGVKNG